MPGGLDPRPYPVNPGGSMGSPRGYPPLPRINPPLPKINPPRLAPELPGARPRRPPNPRWYAEDVPDLMDEQGNRFKPWEVKSQKAMDLDYENRKLEEKTRKIEDFLRRFLQGKSGQWET